MITKSENINEEDFGELNEHVSEEILEQDKLDDIIERINDDANNLVSTSGIEMPTYVGARAVTLESTSMEPRHVLPEAGRPILIPQRKPNLHEQNKSVSSTMQQRVQNLTNHIQQQVSVY